MTSTGQPWNEPTLWPEATHANHSLSPADTKGQTTPNTCGPTSPTAFAHYDPDTQYWKTSQTTLLSDLDTFSQTWPRSGMTRDGTAYQLPPSAPRTSAIAYSLSQGSNGPNSDGLWPTATTQDHATRYKQGGMPLGMAARIADGPNGQLNPTWVEWLMGFPQGWTDLEA